MPAPQFPGTGETQPVGTGTTSGSAVGTSASYNALDSEMGKYSNAHTYQEFTGKVIAPRSAAAPTVIELHAPYGMRVMEFTAIRDQRPPVVPAGRDGDNDTYIAGDLQLSLMPNGLSYSWVVKGQYTYLQEVDAYTSGYRKLDGTASLPTGDQIVTTNTVDGTKALVPSFTDIDQLSDNLVATDPKSNFPWPFTTFPKDCLSTDILDKV